MTMEIDPVEFGRGVGEIIHQAIAPLARRVAELELLVKGIDQKEVDLITKEILAGDHHE